MKNLFAQHTEKEIEDGIYCIYQHFKIFWRQAAREEKADFGEPCAECEKYNQACRSAENIKSHRRGCRRAFCRRI